MAHEAFEEGELTGREVVAALISRDHPRAGVEGQTGGLHDLRPAVGAGEGAHPRGKLAEGEGLGQVVVGAHVEQSHLVLDLADGAQHEHGGEHLRRAHAADDLPPIAVGELQVEKDEIEPAGEGGLQRFAARGGPFEEVSLSRQALDDERGDAVLVFDEQDPHGCARSRPSSGPT